MGKEYLRAVPTMTDVERQIQIAMDAKQRATDCLEAIKDICVKWNCRVQPSINITDRGVESDFNVIPEKGMLVGGDVERDAQSRCNNCMIEIQHALEAQHCGIIPKVSWQVVPITGLESLGNGNTPQ